MFDFINSNKFSNLANLIYHPSSGYVITNEWKNNGIIFTKPDHIDSLFNDIKFLSSKFILITHSSDYPIDQNRFLSKTDNIIKWFAVNATFDHPDLIPIPLGLETDRSEYGMQRGEGADYFEWFFENLDRLKALPKDDKTVFASFKVDYHFESGIWTNPFRKNIMPILKQNGLTCYRPEEKMPYKFYIEGTSKFMFHIVPIGNGIDNHRIAECLYMGCIPIVLKNRIYRDWDLPILQVNSWDELTNEFLGDYVKRKIRTPWNIEQMKFTYWKKRILEEFKKL